MTDESPETPLSTIEAVDSQDQATSPKPDSPACSDSAVSSADPAVSSDPAEQAAVDRARRRLGIDGVSNFMGMRWDSPERIRMEIRPELIGAGGLLSGVATYGLVDYCMGSTLWVHTSEDEHIATVSISINYIQTATEGEVICTSQLDRRNRSNAVLRSEVHHDDGRLLVTAIGNYAIYPARRRGSAV